MDGVEVVVNLTYASTLLPRSDPSVGRSVTERRCAGGCGGRCGHVDEAHWWNSTAVNDVVDDTGPRVEQEIVELLHALGTQMHAVGSRFAAAEALHATDVQALSVLALAGGSLTAGELARALELSSGATTRLVDRLERVGHVARRTDDVDRRRRHVAITPAAATTAGAFFGRIGDLMREVLADYEPAQQRAVRDVLRDVVAAMEVWQRD
jgi:DNA-binding MarR family transcriptional regulator